VNDEAATAQAPPRTVVHASTDSAPGPGTAIFPDGERDPLWFKRAVFYELLVRAFADSNDDGIGDFPGLISKLDYLQWLGVDCIWLLPFNNSPMRDGGYDISDYYDVHPDYGTVDDVRRFVDEAHRRGMRVIMDLVINHTSDQHPWFQEARSSPDNPYRDWYVWSDTKNKFTDARIIFIDSETSNWTWDEQAGAYYFHRFFNHQPDLNYDNPAVRQEIVNICRFWLELGMDGFRLDAVPYLFCREGTNCENLPETHEFLADLRATVDREFADKVLLAEANQWPEDVIDYFGTAERPECHMCFHFPLMPRMFMGLRREQRYPITEILGRTPPIRDDSQWGLFLRNHDELTLEMVTDEERDYMWGEYAQDPRMKLNLGIRRRLAPLLNNGRRQIELFYGLLLSLPGSPILYYGDEIGMGDNVYLGDRDGVRTPMQWSEDRNGGFSRADFAQLYLPPLMDPVYGYAASNVAAQKRSESSLLHWLRRFMAVRSRWPVFGQGSFEALDAANPSVFAFLRTLDDHVVLCVNNLSRFAQPVELDLRRYNGMTPVEMLGRVHFPRIGELPYLLTMGPHGFYWFTIEHVER
jgi:maltose alpha-D-glucosyltransferase / alpha-amylase